MAQDYCTMRAFLLAVTNTGGQIRGLIQDVELQETVLDVCYEAARQRKFIHQIKPEI